MLRSIVKYGILVLNIIVVAVFVISATAHNISPERFVYFSSLGIVFLPLFFVNLCFVIFWLCRFKWYFLLSLMVMILFHNHLRISLSLTDRQNRTEFAGEKIRVMTYNVMLFNYYDQNTRILDYIANSDADIVCLQEFGWHKNDELFLGKKEIFSRLNRFPYYHVYIVLDGEQATYGIATFSRFPIINRQRIEYEGNFAVSIFSDIKIGNDTLRVFNNHLESNKFTEYDRQVLSENISPEIIAHAAQKLKAATVIRARQAEVVAEEIRNSPHRVLVCGDFNDVPVSYTYMQISRGLNDTFVGSGAGLGVTFHDLWFPLRIDYILTDKAIGHSGFFIDRVKYSDHYPVFSNIFFLPTNYLNENK